MARTQVQSELLAVNSISGTIIADNAITATHIATNAISGTLVQDGGIVTVMIAANNVTATKIVTDAVQTRHIADDQVTEAKLANAINTSIAAKLPLAGGTLTGNIAHASDFTIDAGGDIILDADGADIKFRDGGAGFFTITNSSLDAVLKVEQSNEDLLFKGNDGGSEVTALTLNMASGGDAIFNTSVGIGTAAVPDTKLHVKDTGNIELRLEADSNNNGQEDCFIRFYTDGKTQEGIAGMDNNNSSTLFSGNTENAMVFGTVSNLPVVLATNNTERFQISAAGNVGINNTSPAQKLHVGGNVRFSTTPTDGNESRFDFTAGGASDDPTMTLYRHDGVSASVKFRPGLDNFFENHILVGTTSTSFSSANGVKLINDGRVASVASYSDNSYENYTMYSTGVNNWRFYVGWAGRISAVTTSINQISDERLKENILDIDTGLAEICALKPRRFDWKGNEGTGEKGVQGFIAQEVETVMPELVGNFKHNTLADCKSVMMGDAFPTVVKAIQELKAENDALKARIETLEG